MTNKTSNQQLSFQRRVSDWMMETFSMEVTRDTTERNHRFLEEALELVQSLNCTREEAHMLVDYVFGRPIGAPEQEVGGVTVTLAALCNAADIDVIECGERELSRCWLNIDRIRAKHAGKPRSSPLPGPSSVETDGITERDKLVAALNRLCPHRGDMPPGMYEEPCPRCLSEEPAARTAIEGDLVPDHWWRVHRELAKGHTSAALAVVAAVLEGRTLPECSACNVTKLTINAEKASASSSLDRKVTVCAACLCACCWQGEFYCDQAKAGTVEKTIRELLQGNVREDSGYWFKDPNTGAVDYDAKSAAKRAWLAENGNGL